MHKTILVILAFILLVSVTGCTTTQKGAVVGALGGAAIGGVGGYLLGDVDEDNNSRAKEENALQTAAVGALVGAVVGGIIGYFSTE